LSNFDLNIQNKVGSDESNTTDQAKPFKQDKSPKVVEESKQMTGGFPNRKQP